MSDVTTGTDLIGYMTNRMSRRAFTRNTLLGSAGLAAFGALTQRPEPMRTRILPFCSSP